MEPRIQYARTADGVNIAFWTLGEGRPLVQMFPFSHIQLEWQILECSRGHERLAEQRNLVRYDGRGTGLSDREVTDHSLDALLLDLEAVVDRLGLETFALFANHDSGPVAIAYAARHPERVSHLILWCSWVRGSDAASPQLRGLGRLMNTNWELYTETMAHAVLGWSEGEPARQFAALIRESVTREEARAVLRALGQLDVTALLPKVTSPTLVLHRRRARLPHVNVARELASGIPDARLALLEGESGVWYLGDTEPALQAINEFLGEGKEAAARQASGAVDVHTILFTDMEGSTALTQHLGDAKAQELLRTHNTIVRDALKAHGGSQIKHTGDGIMASFPSASGALDCAVAIQRAVAERHAEPVEASLRVRIGLNAGEPVAEDEDLFGTAVQLARRICDRAEPAQILVSNVVRELAAGKGFLFADRGDVELRGFEDPVRLYEVRWRD